jgi:hypothetical protein
MGLPRSVEITGLLRAWSGGDQAALDRLAVVVYDELHRMARHYMRNEHIRNTLQTTALVNEVYLRLVDVKKRRLATTRPVLCDHCADDASHPG